MFFVFPSISSPQWMFFLLTFCIWAVLSTFNANFMCGGASVFRSPAPGSVNKAWCALKTSFSRNNTILVTFPENRCSQGLCGLPKCSKRILLFKSFIYVFFSIVSVPINFGPTSTSYATSVYCRNPSCHVSGLKAFSFGSDRFSKHFLTLSLFVLFFSVVFENGLTVPSSFLAHCQSTPYKM